ncbi:hypothetical protein DAPPUDRAFT_319323 [Daphnia pulex]|uniref:Uncharacterized protein n=1 Tax=Daphnia pulex TaxID=6669 RepID=E9GLD0_DAPPU|nr:hypothetical protein DAPPUDRAFT_319323 [Daphnia pulex]|eukprot:EFX79491.1 hypothetical protein DAPPUDRAFT_319323 [Daphnia pulex]
MQSHLFRYLLGPIILSAFPDALFHQPPHLPRQGQFIPLLPYGSPLHVLFNNQPRYHEYAEDDAIHLRPSYFFVKTIRQMNDNQNDQQEETDVRSRNKNGMVNEYPDAQLRINSLQRFLFGGSNTNPFWKTATYTSVASLSVTSVQNCIPANLFAAGSSTNPCRRKRREIPQEDTLQFPIDPSKRQRLTVTALPSMELLMRNNHQPRTTIVSSKEEVIPNEDGKERQDLEKENRLFYKFVASTTAYSYVFSTFLITRTIRPTGNNFQTTHQFGILGVVDYPKLNQPP